MIRTSSSRLLCAALAATVALTSTTAIRTAHAQPTPAAIASAKSLVAEGRKLRDAGDNKGARDKFRAAYALVPTPIIGLDLGKADVALGELVEAREVLTAVVDLPPNSKESDESKAARKEAADLATSLKERIPTLTVVLAGAANASDVGVRLDYATIPLAALTQPLKVDPGAHVVTVTAKGAPEKKVDVTLAEGESKSVTIDVPTAEATTTVTTGDAVDTPSSSSHSGTSPLVYVGFGVAVAGVAVGSITGLMSLSKASDVKSSCVNFQCPPETHDEFDSSRRLGTISTIAFVVGAVGAGVGVVGLLSGGKEAAPEPKTAASGPTMQWWIGPGSVGVYGAY